MCQRADLRPQSPRNLPFGVEVVVPGAALARPRQYNPVSLRHRVRQGIRCTYKLPSKGAKPGKASVR